MPRTVLIDGDVLAYSVASACEQAIEWEPGFWTWHCREDEVRAGILEGLEAIRTETDATDHIIALSDDANFRLSIFPDYKAHRRLGKRPLVLKAIRQWLIEEHAAMVRPGLEGDDILGILATKPGYPHGERIVFSVDKDLRTIPCTYVRTIGSTPATITEEAADQWHMIQTLAGDPTDGYPGCPGIGMERATKAVEASTALVPYSHEITRGKRRGEVETRYEEVPTDSLWDVVVSRYLAAGRRVEDALTQARVARILRASDYDFQNKEIRLWTPTPTP